MHQCYAILKQESASWYLLSLSFYSLVFLEENERLNTGLKQEKFNSIDFAARRVLFKLISSTVLRVRLHSEFQAGLRFHPGL